MKPKKLPWRRRYWFIWTLQCNLGCILTVKMLWLYLNVLLLLTFWSRLKHDCWNCLPVLVLFIQICINSMLNSFRLPNLICLLSTKSRPTDTLEFHLQSLIISREEKFYPLQIYFISFMLRRDTKAASSCVIHYNHIHVATQHEGDQWCVILYSSIHIETQHKDGQWCVILDTPIHVEMW